MFRQKQLACFVPLLPFYRETYEKRQLLHRTESLQMFNVSFTLLAYYEILQYLWHFSNSFGIFVMFSINFESDLVLLHSRATSAFNFIDVNISKAPL